MAWGVNPVYIVIGIIALIIILWYVYIYEPKPKRNKDEKADN